MNAFQLKIKLDNTKPPIWRRVEVSSDITFFELHHIIQIAMGWANYHLFEFNITGYRIGMIDDEFGDPDYSEARLLDCKTTKLNDVLSGETENFKYDYDFGDGWTHTITVEKLLPRQAEELPVCVKGKLNCPPEDCGGIMGFYDMLKIIGDKKHKEHKEMIQWPGDYDPDELDVTNINDQLRDLEQYIKEWSDE